MTLGHIASLAGVAVLVLIVNVAASFLYVAVYAYVINRGHPEQFYRDYAQVAAPYCSIIAGMPLMFLAGWWVSGWWGGQAAVQSALLVWLSYAVIDTAIVAAVGFTRKIAVIVVISLLTKLLGAYLGAVVGGRAAVS